MTHPIRLPYREAWCNDHARIVGENGRCLGWDDEHPCEDIEKVVVVPVDRINYQAAEGAAGRLIAADAVLDISEFLKILIDAALGIEEDD